LLYFAVAALVVILDQSTKWIIRETFTYPTSTNVIGSVLRITPSWNEGAILGILSNSRPVLITITIISIAALIVFAHRMRFAPAAKRVFVGLILGGAFGNLIDRLAAGKVLDFLDMGIGQYRWPVYNVADIAVTVGAVCLIFGFIRHAEPVHEHE
jgi:signal peptidase II